MATETRSSGSLVRWALPIGLFVVIVGAIAWISQNLPKGLTKKVDAPVVQPNAPTAPLRFLANRAIWDDTDPDYVKEFETGSDGFYDFPFINPGTTPVTLGFGQSSCDCSQLKVAVFEPELAAGFATMSPKNPLVFPKDPVWTALSVNEKAGVEIPVGGAGVARMQWNGRKGPGQRLRLNIRMWMQPTGRPDDRSFETLEVPIVMSEPLRFTTEKLSLGVMSSGGVLQGEFIAWSPTREGLDLKIDTAKLPPHLEATIAKLDDAARKRLDASFREDRKGTRVRSAFRIVAKVSEKKDDKQLDQGPFRREIPLLSADIPFPLQTPLVTVHVRGDIDVGAAEDNGAVHLKSFSAKNGVRKTVPVWHDGADELTVESVYPTVLEVKLTRSAKESTPARGKWSLDVNVPPGAWHGPFQEDAVILLKTNSTPPRKIRIPVVGNGGQG